MEFYCLIKQLTTNKFHISLRLLIAYFFIAAYKCINIQSKNKLNQPEVFPYLGFSFIQIFILTLSFPNINNDKCHAAVMTILTNKKSHTFLQLS